MKKNLEYVLGMTILTVALVAIVAPVATFAQGNSGNGTAGSLNSSEGIRDQDRDQDRLQDPDVGGEDEPDQARDQLRDQEQLHATSVDGTTNVTQQDRDRDRDRIQDPVLYDDHEPVQDRDQLRVSTAAELTEVINKTRSQFEVEEQAATEPLRNIYRNQNQVRIAAVALASTSDLFGSLGPVVRRITSEYQESVLATIAAEEHIQNRSRISSFLFGGDKDTAYELEQERLKNLELTKNLNLLINVWEGDPAIKKILQEQVQAMEQEQARLHQIVVEESISRGLLDYLLFWQN